MNSLTSAETTAARRLIELALAEDLNQTGDRTSQATIPADLPGRAAFVARAAGTIAGLPVVQLVLEAVDRTVRFEPLLADGAAVAAGDRLATVDGPMRSILTAERTALNFLQRLSGVATLTRRYVEAAAAGGRAKVFDTRKTTPGWRLLEKYAVRQGGGHNHRMGLFDGLLIKDNHLAALGGGPDPIRKAVDAARAHAPGLPVEVEVDTAEQFAVALACGPDIILLDNMRPDVMRQCLELRDKNAPAVRLEASGGVNLQTIAAIAATGVDFISVGALTHSAAALDIALDYLLADTAR
ncbi:MAG TPA: carboxylating nicotinate-nucleotide diphosphorylase [Gemmataceae bacterium]|nr:carboxylating nicotinate-nucleotide diphosphorylase [Gemmataceae bacterium]